MDSLTRNLNLIRLQGTAEQLEETRITLLELRKEIKEKTPPHLSTIQLDNANWFDWLDAMKPLLNDHQLKLLSDFLDQLAKEISSRRERDITLI